MLVLERKTGEGIVIGDGPDKVYVSISKSNDGKVKLGIVAPKHIAVDRIEVRAKKDREGTSTEAKSC